MFERVHITISPLLVNILTSLLVSLVKLKQTTNKIATFYKSSVDRYIIRPKWGYVAYPKTYIFIYISHGEGGGGFVRYQQW